MQFLTQFGGSSTRAEIAKLIQFMFRWTEPLSQRQQHLLTARLALQCAYGCSASAVHTDMQPTWCLSSSYTDTERRHANSNQGRPSMKTIWHWSAMFSSEAILSCNGSRRMRQLIILYVGEEPLSLRGLCAPRMLSFWITQDLILLTIYCRCSSLSRSEPCSEGGSQTTSSGPATTSQARCSPLSFLRNQRVFFPLWQGQLQTIALATLMSSDYWTLDRHNSMLRPNTHTHIFSTCLPPPFFALWEGK